MADVQKFIDGLMDSLARDYLDASFGANRTLNGITGGGLDYLGSKLGFDSGMDGYLRLLSPEEKLLREGLGNAAEWGGTVLGLGAGLRGAGAALNGFSRWNGRRELISQLKKGDGFKDVYFGKLPQNKLDGLNELRKGLNQPKLGDKAYIPANVVRKFYNKRLNEGYSPENVAEMGKRLFQEEGGKLGKSQYRHIQQIVKPRNKVDELGYISQNPTTGQTVIKSMYRIDKGRK